MPGADPSNGLIAYGYGAALTLGRVLEQCEDGLSRENIMRQAANLHDLELPVLLPGIRVNTSPTDYCPIQQMRLQRWTGSSWELFGEVMEAA
jgi:branched-chain amino acid transport system substrate-binding protein